MLDVFTLKKAVFGGFAKVEFSRNSSASGAEWRPAALLGLGIDQVLGISETNRRRGGIKHQTHFHQQFQLWVGFEPTPVCTIKRLDNNGQSSSVVEHALSHPRVPGSNPVEPVYTAVFSTLLRGFEHTSLCIFKPLNGNRRCSPVVVRAHFDLRVTGSNPGGPVLTYFFQHRVTGSNPL